MRTVRCSGRLFCHVCPPPLATHASPYATHAPCHAHLPAMHMPHSPCHTCPPGHAHTPLPCMPPFDTNIPPSPCTSPLHHTCPSFTMHALPLHHACPLATHAPSPLPHTPPFAMHTPPSRCMLPLWTDRCL